MNIKKYRKQANLSQEEVACKLGITQQAYSYKERGDRKFTIDEAFKLEEVLGVSIYELFEDLKKL